MKKIINLVVVASLAVLVGVAFANPADTHGSYVADGVVGTSGAAYRVKRTVFRCNTLLDALVTGAPGNGGKPCFGVLRNGATPTATVIPIYLGPTSVTNPVSIVDYTHINRTGLDWSRTGA